MNATLSLTDRTAIDAIVASLASAWNAADGGAFAAPFADDADFVNVRGEHHRGKGAIAGGHAAILSTIYAGSKVRYTVKSARALGDNAALAHVDAALDVPSGPLVGHIDALFSIVLVNAGDKWEIVAFHNTAVAPPMHKS